ncbi:benzoate-CoA ligase family protein [Nitriliruptor alkaliphilus]|uniref:benzoate-CoA ligase family protein n=1 Tax=Nitriliruptor alkaliphilus TaxID=427918 RepID=UPI000697E926|nr:benzoate-CoA ligase family protein [Nitriliruptor alkaliphilus]
MAVDLRANVSLLLEHNLEAGRGDKVALITDDDHERTYRQLHADACRVGTHLRDLGVRREERVLLMLDDTPAFHAAFLGAIRIGAVPVPLNILARSQDYAYYLDDSYAGVAIVDGAFLEKVQPHIAVRPHVTLVVANGAAPDGAHHLDAWLEEGPDELDPVVTHPADPAFWLYSSGSTGRPKGVVHLQQDVLFTCENYAGTVLHLREHDITFSTTKLFHAYGLGNGLTFPMWAGATAVQLAGRPAPDRALDRIEQHRPQVLFSVPTLYNAMLNQPDVQSRDLSSLRTGASAAEALPPEVWRRWKEVTGTEILDGVGSTELLHIYCSNRTGECRPGTSGTPVPGYELEIRDPESDEVIRGTEAGELWASGGSALAYYHHQREKTQHQVVGRWFRTGDRYRRDEAGAYVYEGRVDDMMKVGGLWVSPIEIENRLMEHAAVLECAVVAAEVDALTKIRAFVILRDGHEADGGLTHELQDWCKDALQRYQFPHLVDYVEDLPRTATGKIQRFKLRAPVA